MKGGRRSRAVAVTRRWVVRAAKQGLQQHRELQRTLQRTWSPAERYSASRVVPVAWRHSEGVRCSRGERFSVRGHRIAPVAHGRPPLENREESDRAAMHALTATAPRRRNCRFTASSRFLNGKKGRAKWAPFAAIRHAGPNLLRGVEEMERSPEGRGDRQGRIRCVRSNLIIAVLRGDV